MILLWDYYMQCQQIKSNGQRCTFKAKYDGFCGMHRRLPRPTDVRLSSNADMKQCPCYRTDGSRCNKFIPVSKATCHMHRKKCRPAFEYRFDINYFRERVDDDVVEVVERIFSNPDNFSNLSVFTVLRFDAKDTYDNIVRSGKLTGAHDKNNKVVTDFPPIPGLRNLPNKYQCTYFSLFFDNILRTEPEMLEAFDMTYRNEYYVRINGLNGYVKAKAKHNNGKYGVIRITDGWNFGQGINLHPIYDTRPNITLTPQAIVRLKEYVYRMLHHGYQDGLYKTIVKALIKGHEVTVCSKDWDDDSVFSLPLAELDHEWHLPKQPINSSVMGDRS